MASPVTLLYASFLSIFNIILDLMWGTGQTDGERERETTAINARCKHPVWAEALLTVRREQNYESQKQQPRMVPCLPRNYRQRRHQSQSTSASTSNSLLCTSALTHVHTQHVYPRTTKTRSLKLFAVLSATVRNLMLKFNFLLLITYWIC